MSPAVKLFLILIGVMVAIDLVFLNAAMLGGRQEKLSERLIAVEERLTALVVSENEGVSRPLTVAPGDEPETSLSQTPKSLLVTTAAPVTREVFIPLGSASTFSTEWLDTGAQVYIDTTVYADIREAYFQASLRSNSGVVYARLKQMNEKVAVPGSEISHAGGTATFVGSGEILLSPGNKLYAVQLRSQTGQEVFVENARVRLVLR